MLKVCVVDLGETRGREREKNLVGDIRLEL